MASSPDDGGYGRTRLWGSVGWGAVAPLAGWVVSRYGLTAAFLTFTAVVGLSLLLAVLLPMEALSQRAQCCADGATGAAGRAVSDAGSDKLGGGGKGGRRSSLEGESLLSVHVSAGSATAGKPALPASPTSWAIGSTLQGLPGGAAKPAKPAPGSRPVVSLIAVASSATGLASPERPLLAAVASGSPSPQRQPAPSAADATTTSSLEIDAGSPRGGAAPAQQAAGGAGSGASVWQGVRVLLRDPHVLAFFFLAFAMGEGAGGVGRRLAVGEAGAPRELLHLTRDACAPLISPAIPVFPAAGIGNGVIGKVWAGGGGQRGAVGETRKSLWSPQKEPEVATLDMPGGRLFAAYLARPVPCSLLQLPLPLPGRAWCGGGVGWVCVGGGVGGVWGGVGGWGGR